MNNIIILLRKDCILAKKYFIILLLYTLVLPYLYVQILKPQDSLSYWMVGFIQFFVILMVITNSISSADENNNKVIELLNAAPFTRTQVVLARYIYDISIFVVFWVMLLIESLIAQKNFLHISALGLGSLLLFICLYRGIALPFEYKFGYSTSKNIFTIITLAVVFGIPMLSTVVDFNKYLGKIMGAFSSDINYGFLSAIIYIIAIGISALSCAISVRIYKNKDL